MFFSRRLLVWPSALFLLTALCVVANAQAPREEILRFDSRIVVLPDSTMTVTETIAVRALGRDIKRGVYRDFPTEYHDKLGNAYSVRFDVTQVRKDDSPEPWRMEKRANGFRVYIGSSDVFLDPGEYVYTLAYRTDRQLGFFKEYDELYWNVTGNGWAFPILQAEAVVRLPPGASVVQMSAYTGPQGAQGEAYEKGFDTQGDPVFRTTEPLMPGEGLTIAVAWPKGFVKEPTTTDRIVYVLWDNASLLAGLVGMLLLLGYYFWAWSRVGRDPEGGTIIPLFEPPKGFSPAAARYVMNMGFDDKAFTAAVLNMAVKGYLAIHKDKKEYTLEKTSGVDGLLSPGERKAASILFSGRETLLLKQTNHEILTDAAKALDESLHDEFGKICFRTNAKYLIPGGLLTLLTMFAMAIFAGDADSVLLALFMSAWLTVWTIGCAVLSRRAWRGLKSHNYFFLLFSAPFFIGELFGIGMYAEATSPLCAAGLVAAVCAGVLFHYLLKAPTLQGRAIMDQIEGFKLFLSVTEKHRLEVMNPPHVTPQVFEKYLPYALALDVENEWSERFSADMAAAGLDPGDYSPVWWRGPHLGAAGVAGFGSDLGTSFTNAIASSSSAPGSASGSGGGGSSGGGGGGGGGGGW